MRLISTILIIDKGHLSYEIEDFVESRFCKVGVGVRMQYVFYDALPGTCFRVQYVHMPIKNTMIIKLSIGTKTKTGSKTKTETKSKTAG